ncbi:hypothetical protein [Neptuniibacter sp. CAU 1671]|uniref:hypothetical protein n=1 Tax=Neptuniibacter sp. CAU 1671 TaxID=3032593 RepID=UPI0023DB1FE6|nr:hypothetical protein [Neptuniibacter sp. CAU 1671]MDF2182916.1 hypothetical protein [Neptuniibacter sp. CAU 1671]
MKWMIIILIMMSLIGSMMWVMPTPRQKYQAKLRLQAKKIGFRVQLERVTLPRAKGEMEPETTTVTAYRLIRNRRDKKLAQAHIPWTVYRISAVADLGLPQGWSWGLGEKTLSEPQLDMLTEIIEAMPDDVLAIESSPVEVGVFWSEEGGEAMLDLIKTQLERLLDANL